MKTTMFIFISYVTLLGTFLPGIAQGAISSQGAAPSPAFIYPNPVIPLPKNQGGTTSSPQSGSDQELKLPEITEEQKKCLVSFVNKGMSTCLEDLGNSFVTSKINVRPECCSALDGLTDQCRLAIHFQNQGFEDLVQNYCTSGGAMAPGGPAEGPDVYQEGSFPDMTGQMDAGFGSAFGPGPSEGPSSYGPVDETNGSSLAEGPTSGESTTQDVGQVVGNETPTTTTPSESTEDVGHIVENANPTNGESLAEPAEPAVESSEGHA